LKEEPSIEIEGYSFFFPLYVSKKRKQKENKKKNYDNLLDANKQREYIQVNQISH